MLSEEIIRMHLRMEEDDELDTDYVTLLVESVISQMESDINAKLYPDLEKLNDAVASITPRPRAFVFEKQLKVAALHLFEHWFENRSSTTTESIRSTPKSYQFIITRFKQNPKGG